MALYFVNVPRPLFVLHPLFELAAQAVPALVGSVLVAAAVTSKAIGDPTPAPLAWSTSGVNRLRAAELLRDES